MCASASSASATGVSSTDTGLTRPQTQCTTCLASFKTKEEKRLHMREDWHNYNLKRHIASLAPLSRSVYQEKVLSHSSGEDDTEPSSPLYKFCTACQQHFTALNPWKSHLKSKPHLQKSADENRKNPNLSNSLDNLDLAKSADQESDEEICFDPFQCLFCNVESTSIDTNITHMSNAHSFFIPDAEYLIDVESLLSYLFTIVAGFHECLYCGAQKRNKFAVQDHMRDKGHCKVDFEDDEHDLRQFYDLSSDTDEDEQDVENVTLVLDDDKLLLPSGKTLGHRSRARYFRQNLLQRSPSVSSTQQQIPTGTELDADPHSIPAASTDRRVAMRKGTWASIAGVPALQQRVLIAVEQKMMKAETRAKNEYQSHVEKSGNRQKRFKVRSIGKKQGGLEKRTG